MAGNVAVSTSNGRKGLSVLHPKTRTKVEKLMALCKDKGLDLLITETLRTVEDQDKLYAQGRTAPGKIVTKCKGSEFASPHQWAVAIDFAKNKRGEEYSDNKFFKEVADIAKQCGMAAGIDFKNFPDAPHLEDPEFLPNNSTKTLKDKYKTPEEFFKTWK